MTLMLLRGWMNSLGSKSRTSPPQGAIQPAAASCGSGTHAAPPRGDRLPNLLAADADRRNDAQAGDDDFTHEND